MEDSESIWSHLDCLNDAHSSLYEERLLKSGESKNKLKTTKKRENNKYCSKMNNEDEGGASKKLDHNAKERIRRMKLNASFLALRALLPDSRRSKVTISFIHQPPLQTLTSIPLH